MEKVIKVLWNEETQAVRLEFEPKEFRTWQMVKAVLQMAVEEAEDKKKMSMIAGMQRAAQEQAQNEALAKALNGKRLVV